MLLLCVKIQREGGEIYLDFLFVTIFLHHFIKHSVTGIMNFSVVQLYTVLVIVTHMVGSIF